MPLRIAYKIKREGKKSYTIDHFGIFYFYVFSFFALTSLRPPPLVNGMKIVSPNPELEFGKLK